MIKKSKVLAIIPARKGSKRLPNKNKLDLNGKPLISWTIESAMKSIYIDDIAISTDDEDIVEIAKLYDIDVPFLRPVELSSDKASTMDVIFHTINFYKSIGRYYDIIILLQPTSPLRTSVDIDNSFKLLSKDVKAIVSVCELDHSPLWSNVLPTNNSLEFFLKEDVQGLRSQDLPQYYRLNGAIYLSRINYLKTNKKFFGKQSKAYIMSTNNSIDIDTKLDFELCKLIMNENN
jgi:CMP-N,N'-diacetyllegionaminic acid synthase